MDLDGREEAAAAACNFSAVSGVHSPQPETTQVYPPVSVNLFVSSLVPRIVCLFESD
jgi:hypothetical protein